MWTVLLLALLVNCVFCGTEKSFINFGGFVCPREEKALGRCLRDALNIYIPELVTGLPEYGIPPCEPLNIPGLSVQQSSGAISVVSTFSDVIVRGPAKMRVKDVQVNTTNHQLVVKLFIPELKMKGNYKLKGQILMLPIDGDGQFSAKYGNINAVVTIVLGRRPRADDVDALTCESLEVRFHVGDASMQLDNLFGGDGELEDFNVWGVDSLEAVSLSLPQACADPCTTMTSLSSCPQSSNYAEKHYELNMLQEYYIGSCTAMNQFLNENWQKLTEELQVPMEEALHDFLKPLADHAFGTLNADDILSS